MTGSLWALVVRIWRPGLERIHLGRVRTDPLVGLEIDHGIHYWKIGLAVDDSQFDGM